MKKVFQLLAVAFVMTAMLSSCSKDDNETQTNSHWTRQRVNVGKCQKDLSICTKQKMDGIFSVPSRVWDRFLSGKM